MIYDILEFMARLIFALIIGVGIVFLIALLLLGLYEMFIASWIVAWWHFLIGLFLECLFFTIMSYVFEYM